MTEIRCPCGAVELTLTGAPIAQYYCHCDDCRTMHGAACVALVLYPADAVNVTRGAPKMWQLRATPRATCPECGTRIFAEVAPVRARAVVAALLPAGTFRPAFHMQCGHAALPVKDELPHFKGFPPAFGGSSETVDW